MYRIIDFRRDKPDIPAKVQAIEYDPNRSANLALLAYADGDKRYILAPRGIKEGDVGFNTNNRVEFTAGFVSPLNHSTNYQDSRCRASSWPWCTNRTLCRSVCSTAQLTENVRLSSYPQGKFAFSTRCRATIGEVGNLEHHNQSLGKAGRRRWLGRRPRVRGVAMNPVDHPMGGGEGRTSVVATHNRLGVSFQRASQLARSQTYNSQIVVRRNGRQLKKR